MQHLMVDLETYDTLPSAVVLSVGVVPFDPVHGIVDIALGRHWALRRDAQEDRTTSFETKAWWAEQSDEARASWDLPYEEQTLPYVVLYEISKLAFRYPYIWSHGAAFDVVILEDMYRWAGYKAAPWRFQDVRDTRTIYALANVGVQRDIGTHHNALDDAINQARAVCEAYKKLGLSA